MLWALLGALLALPACERDASTIPEPAAIEAETPGSHIELPDTLVADMHGEWDRRWGRPATETELQGLIDQRIREEVLSREAIAMELDRDDPVVRRHLAMKLERLITAMAATDPTEEELAAYLTEHADRYRLDARLSLDQLFVETERRGREAALAEAERRLETLRAMDADAEIPERLGDPMLLPTLQQDVRSSEVAKSFGEDFAARVLALEVGAWHGPVPSAFGLHLVRVRSTTPAVLPALEQIRARVARDFTVDRGRDAADQNYGRMRARYEVVLNGEIVPAP